MAMETFTSDPKTRAHEGRIADNIVHFARTLRKAGVRVGPASVVDAIDAVAFISTVPGCLKLQSNMLLKKLGPRDLPSWVEGFQSAGEQGRPGD